MKSNVIVTFQESSLAEWTSGRVPPSTTGSDCQLLVRGARPDTNTNFELEIFLIKVPPQKPIIMDQTGKRVVGEVLGPLDQGQTITLDCLVNGGKSGGHL